MGVIFDRKCVMPELYVTNWYVIAIYYFDTPGSSFNRKLSQVDNSWYKVCHFWHTSSIDKVPAKGHAHFESVKKSSIPHSYIGIVKFGYIMQAFM